MKCRERRLGLDPEQVARDQRVDEASADVETALEDVGEAQRQIELAELAAGTAVEGLLRERLSVRNVLNWLAWTRRRPEALMGHGTGRD